MTLASLVDCIHGLVPGYLVYGGVVFPVTADEYLRRPLPEGAVFRLSAEKAYRAAEWQAMQRQSVQ